MTNKNHHTKLRNKIRAKLMLNGIQMKDIAKDLKVSRPSVTKVIAGVMASDRIRAEIALRVGSTPSKLWPHK